MVVSAESQIRNLERMKYVGGRQNPQNSKRNGKDDYSVPRSKIVSLSKNQIDNGRIGLTRVERSWRKGASELDNFKL